STKLRKQRVKTRVDEAKRKIEVIYEDVEDWLRSAEKELEETQNLEDEIDSIKCFKWCPKWGWRYCLSKKLAEKTPIISKLLEASNFPQVGYRGSLQGIEFITSTDFMDSESSKSALNQIMEAINAKGVKMIGLHGMPGVGKTTLAQEVGKQAREQKLFDKVVMFTMSQNPNINKIQDKVADIFGLNFETSSREGKAEVLFMSMQGVNKILVIVDDLWEELKLERIGIPFGDEHKGCKILLTTRDQQVCTKMNCTKEIQLGILSEDEAWVLFRGKAGLDDDSSTLNDVAKEVAAQCKGLPLAIVVVAKALKGESLNGWTTLKEWPDMDGCYSAIALWNCSSNIKKLPDKVEFSKLKTLILEGDWDCDWNWDLRQKRKRKRGDLLVVSSIFFEEMKALQVLYLESVSFLPIGFHSLPNLKTAQTLKTVTIANFSSSLTAFNNLFCNVKKLKLRNVSGQKNIVPSVGKTGVNELTSLKLASCKDMEFLIDITSDQGPTVVFSNLVKLNIHNMVSLKGLCYGLSRSHRAIASLTRLRVVTIGSCHQLKTIFSPCLAQSMLCIEKLFIFQCDGVEQVIGFAQEDEIPENDCGLCYWPKLRILHIQSCKSLKYVCASTSTPGLQSLEFLHISHCPQFMQIFNIEQNENGQDIMLPGFRSQNLFEVRIIWNDFAQVVTLENLTTLKLRDCKKLKMYIFTYNGSQFIAFGESFRRGKLWKFEKPLSFWIHSCSSKMNV
ncbi:hypothetical protein, partial [Gossypium barbadense]